MPSFNSRSYKSLNKLASLKSTFVTSGRFCNYSKDKLFSESPYDLPNIEIVLNSIKFLVIVPVLSVNM